jgi:NTE family protein
VPDLVAREAVCNYPTDFAPVTSDDLEALTARGEQLTRMLIDSYCPRLGQ